MLTTKNKTMKDLRNFMAELEEEARFKLAIAKTCGVSPTRILKETGGKNTIDKRIDNMTLIPEYIFAMDRAIKTILMEKDEDDAKIVRSTIDLAHNLGLTVVAEGVENATIWAMLKNQGCDEAQGYFMSKPLPVAEFVAWREKWLQRVFATI